MHIEFDRNAFMAMSKGGTHMGSNQPFSTQAKLIRGVNQLHPAQIWKELKEI